MLNLDNIIHEKLIISEEEEKDLNPFFIAKETVLNLLDKENYQYQSIFKRLNLLAKLFNLNETEVNIIFIVFAPTLNVKYKKIYAYLQDDLNLKEASIPLLLDLLTKENQEEGSIYTYVQSHSPLITFLILEIDENQILKLSKSVQNFLFGLYILDSKVNSYSSFLTNSLNSSYPLNEKIKAYVPNIIQGLAHDEKFIIQMQGQDNLHKMHIANNMAKILNYRLLIVDLVNLLATTDDFEKILSLLFRESILSGSLLYFKGYEEIKEEVKFSLYTSILINKINHLSWLSFIDSKERLIPLELSSEQIWIEISLENPNLDECSLFWEQSLNKIGVELSNKKSNKLSQLFNFTFEQIEKIVTQVKSKLLLGVTFNDSLLYQLCRNNLSNVLDSLAQPLYSDNNIDDIILPKEKKALLMEVSKHYEYQVEVFKNWGFKKHYQSQGITLLLTGVSGTGKSMAASILANELKLDLYRIELSRMVSKYIGETEKNLSKIFTAAEGSGVILFFDEADAIFGKRTETKDSHDRYANIEISYLLQKIEEYDGLVILASNFRQNIDEAFIRRIRFIINFPFPDLEMRKKIWQKVFPKNSPIDESIDFSLLAKRFEFSGANIRNASLFAAFFAIQENEDIKMKHIIHGIKIELDKLGKVIKESDFLQLI